jgi:hypothetical protein
VIPAPRGSPGAQRSSVIRAGARDTQTSSCDSDQRGSCCQRPHQRQTRWWCRSGRDDEACTLAVTGKVVRASGEGLQRVDETKSAAGCRTVPLPRFAAAMLRHHRAFAYFGQKEMIFPSTAGTLRDQNNFGKEWRTARKELGVPEITTHSFRKTVATLIDDEGLSAPIGATTSATRRCR